MSEALDGLLVVDKPAGMTSHDVVARVRRLAGTRRVGHAGTLDPMATGVLVIGVGRATRLLGHLAMATKEYDATIRLGEATTTDDAEGDVVARADASAVGDAAIGAAVTELTGDLMQVPAAVSAIKVDGQRAYRRVRAGESVELAARPVTVSRFEVVSVRRLAGLVDVDVHVECSTGTYVRALARDLGGALAVGGHLTGLRRTRVGRYPLEAAHPLGALDPDAGLPIVPLSEVAAGFSTYRLSEAEEAAARHGRPLTADLGSSGPVAMLTQDGRFLALYQQQGALAKPLAVFVG